MKTSHLLLCAVLTVGALSEIYVIFGFDSYSFDGPIYQILVTKAKVNHNLACDLEKDGVTVVGHVHSLYRTSDDKKIVDGDVPLFFSDKNPEHEDQNAEKEFQVLESGNLQQMFDAIKTIETKKPDDIATLFYHTGELADFSPVVKINDMLHKFQSKIINKVIVLKGNIHQLKFTFLGGELTMETTMSTSADTVFSGSGELTAFDPEVWRNTIIKTPSLATKVF